MYVTAFPALPCYSGCTHMTSAWFLSLPNGQRTNKCRVACQILSPDAPNQAIILYSSHPQDIRKRERGTVCVKTKRRHQQLFATPSANTVISTTSSCLRQSRRKNHVRVEIICPILRKERVCFPALPL